jgi:hypothetical protein
MSGIGASRALSTPEPLASPLSDDANSRSKLQVPSKGRAAETFEFGGAAEIKRVEPR